MRYLCLVYLDERRLDRLSAAAWDALLAETRLCEEDLRESGHALAAGALQPAEMALTVSGANGSLAAVEGPVDGAWRQLGWFLLLEARDLNEAARLAAKLPPARLGAVEVRPLAER
jgi:hypothetical protein